MILLYSISALLLLSIVLNILLFIKLKKQKHKPKLDTNAQNMLQDMMNNGAMLHIQVLDAGDYFLKSPRG